MNCSSLGGMHVTISWPYTDLPNTSTVIYSSNGQVRTKAEGLIGQKYVEMILKGPLVGRNGAARQFEREIWREVLAVEDGAPAHNSIVAQDARAKFKIRNLKHPASSPELNPIENIWWTLKSSSRE